MYGMKGNRLKLELSEGVLQYFYQLKNADFAKVNMQTSHEFSEQKQLMHGRPTYFAQESAVHFDSHTFDWLLYFHKQIAKNSKY